MCALSSRVGCAPEHAQKQAIHCLVWSYCRVLMDHKDFIATSKQYYSDLTFEVRICLSCIPSAAIL